MRVVLTTERESIMSLIYNRKGTGGGSGPGSFSLRPQYLLLLTWEDILLFKTKYRVGPARPNLQSED
jgi:hypothetical protein